MLPEFPPGTVVKLNGSGLALHRKLSSHGTSGIAFAENHLTHEEATGPFEYLGHDDGRDARVRSQVTGREGLLFRGMLRRA